MAKITKFNLKKWPVLSPITTFLMPKWAIFKSDGEFAEQSLPADRKKPRPLNRRKSLWDVVSE
jgi:hypothetical protein